MAATNDHDNRAIRLDYGLSALPEKGWSALTRPKLLKRWLLPNDMVPLVDQRFAFHTSPAPGFDGLINCQLTQAEPSRRLASDRPSGPINTVVTWTFELRAADGTRLLLVHADSGRRMAKTSNSFLDDVFPSTPH